MTYDQSQELYHYGVRGMRWGVRRASKTLISTKASSDKKKKAVASLQKHKQKATKKVIKLTAKNEKLGKKNDKFILKNDAKIAKLNRKAAKKRAKAYGLFTSKSKTEKLKFKAEKLEAKAAKLSTKRDEVKAKMAKNDRLISMYNEGISHINKVSVSNGKKYLGK